MTKPKVYGRYYAVADEAPSKVKRSARWVNDEHVDNTTWWAITAAYMILAALPFLIFWLPSTDEVAKGIILMLAFVCCLLATKASAVWLMSRAYKHLLAASVHPRSPMVSGQKAVFVNQQLCTTLGALVTNDDRPVQDLEALLDWAETHCFDEFAQLNWLAMEVYISRQDEDAYRQRCANLYNSFKEWPCL